jgi:hypothetical protein
MSNMLRMKSWKHRPRQSIFTHRRHESIAHGSAVKKATGQSLLLPGIRQWSWTHLCLKPACSHDDGTASAQQKPEYQVEPVLNPWHSSQKPYYERCATACGKDNVIAWLLQETKKYP